MSGYHIFIVEDDPWYGEILQYHLSLNPDYKVTKFMNGKDCLQNLYQRPDLITMDYSLPDMNGDELLKQVQQVNPGIPVIIISAQEDVTTAIELYKKGIADYLVKDDHTKDLLWNAVNRIRENQALKKEVEVLREELGQKYEFEKVIKGSSAAMKKIFALMEKATKTNINVSVTGETGTGKELVAKAIHYNSDRKKKPFVALNMAAIPAELLESELFGHEKGAFTGALNRKIGKFEEANGGTLFLDEIGEMELNLQSKLLRVLQERELSRVGGSDKVKLDIRLVVATHKNLADQVKQGRFREDFYYRIMGLPIELPPLRERGNDLLVLAKFFLDEFCKENKMPLKQFSADAKDRLMKYHFPGNVRELKSMIDLAVVMSDGAEIQEGDIRFSAPQTEEDIFAKEKTLKEYNNQIIQHFLNKYNHNVVSVAEKLDVGKSTIYKLIQEKEIEG
jgi:two-component system response regulator AtoC